MNLVWWFGNCCYLGFMLYENVDGYKDIMKGKRLFKSEFIYVFWFSKIIWLFLCDMWNYFIFNDNIVILISDKFWIL